MSSGAAEVKVTQSIGASAERVWAMVSDVTRMGEWSPENESAKWLSGTTRPERGVKFEGTNRNGKKKWKTIGRIIEAEPGRLFAFRVTAAGFKVAEWRYELQATETGCELTETWIDQRGHIAAALGKPVSGVTDRASHNRAGMEETMRRIKSAAESGS